MTRPPVDTARLREYAKGAVWLATSRRVDEERREALLALLDDHARLEAEVKALANNALWASGIGEEVVLLSDVRAALQHGKPAGEQGRTEEPGDE